MSVCIGQQDCFVRGGDKCFAYCFVLRQLIFSVKRSVCLSVCPFVRARMVEPFDHLNDRKLLFRHLLNHSFISYAMRASRVQARFLKTISYLTRQIYLKSRFLWSGCFKFVVPGYGHFRYIPSEWVKLCHEGQSGSSQIPQNHLISDEANFFKSPPYG